jgi:hypothetical protein
MMTIAPPLLQRRETTEGFQSGSRAFYECDWF